FFQAEDGIRDFHVTGVQTCALPISSLIEPSISIKSPLLIYFLYAFPLFNPFTKTRSGVFENLTSSSHHQERCNQDQHFYADHLQDRKSTRLNSSHVKISYAVFC